MTSPVGFIPPPDLSFIGDIGEAIAQIIDPRREEREQVRQFFLANPQIGGQFALAQRQAEEEFFSLEEPSPDVARADVPAPNVLEPFGFSREQTQRFLKIFPTTLEQEVEAGVVAVGGVEELVRTRLATARGQRAQSVLTTAISEAQLANQIPQREAILSGLRITYDQRELLTASQNLDDWNAHLERLRRTNPGRFQIMLESMNAPAFQEFLLRSRELDIREAEGLLASLKAQAELAESEQERQIKLFEIGIKAEDALADRLEELRTAFDKGLKEEQLAALSSVNRLIRTVAATNPDAATFRLEVRDKLFGFGLDFVPVPPQSLQGLADRETYLAIVERFAQRSGEEFSQLQNELLQTPQAASFLARLSEEERQQLLRDAEAAHFRAREQGGSLFERINEGVGPAEAAARKGTETAVGLQLQLQEVRNAITSVEERIREAESELSTATGRQAAVLRARLSDLRREVPRLRAREKRLAIQVEGLPETKVPIITRPEGVP